VNDDGQMRSLPARITMKYNLTIQLLVLLAHRTLFKNSVKGGVSASFIDRRSKRAAAFVGSQNRQWMSKVYVSARAAVTCSGPRPDFFDEGG
jgi:hypothetical protein